MLTLVSYRRVDVMRAFDTLPQRIRLAIAKADFPYDPRDIAKRLADGRRAAEIARTIERGAAP